MGRRGAGKTTTAKFIADTFGYYHIEMSQIMRTLRTIMDKEGMVLRNFVDLMHKERSKSFAVKHLHENKMFQENKIVITGIRNLNEIELMKSNYSKSTISTIYLSLNFHKRLKRVLLRENENNFIDFIYDEYYCMKWGDKNLLNNSEKVINSDSFSQTKNEIENLIIEYV